MSVPDALPVLSRGHHPWGSGKACLMDAISWLSGQPEWGDAPECVHPVVRAAAIEVNDRMPESERYKLWALVPDLIGTAPENNPHESRILSVRLASFAARYVLHLVPDEHRPVCERAIATAEAWCEGKVTLKGCLAAANAAYLSHNVTHATKAAYTAAYAAARAASACDCNGSSAAAAHSAAASAADSANPYDLLAALVAEHRRRTGHQPRPIEEHEWEKLCRDLGVR